MHDILVIATVAGAKRPCAIVSSTVCRSQMNRNAAEGDG